MRLPDKATSRAVLIGTGMYDELPDIGAVGNCLNDLATVLAGPPDAPFAPEHCSTLVDPAVPADVFTVLHQRAQEAEDVLLVYFVGHGARDLEGNLYLGLRGTQHEGLEWTALSFEHVRRELMQSRADTVVLILDCSYAGRGAEQLAGRNAVVLSATSATRHAIAPTDGTYTAFTGELLRLFSGGVMGGPPLLDMHTIFSSLRASLTALGWPEPQMAGAGSFLDLGLVPNAAYDPAAPELQPATPQSPPPEEAAEPAAVEEEVELTADAAATLDLLERGPIATVIAMRLAEAREAAPELSFFVHIDGSWGSGKSTLLNLLRERLAEHFLIVEFDAWQQSRLGPPWWSLLTATRRQVLRGRPWLRVRETASRMRRTGAPFGLALVVVLAVAAVVAYMLWPQQHSLKNWSENIKALIAIAAAVGTLVTSALVASRFLLFDSVRGAKLFEQTQANPIREIAAHFRWLLRHSRKPVAFFVDDLDRCQQSYVVDFLDTAHTMIRDTSQEPAAYFVVAADGAWLRRSYEKAHADFAESLERPGRPIGYLFLDKLFQLTIPMPLLTAPAQARYLDAILRIERPGPEQGEGTTSIEVAEGAGDPSGLEERLRAFGEGRARQAAHVSLSPEERRRTEHVLRRFAHLLGNNPRGVKRFLNTYSILHSIRRLEGNLIKPESLALWTILVVRWPAIAAHLQDDPGAVKGIMQPVWVTEHFPEALLELARSPELCDVITCETGGPLTPDLIRQCVGLALGG